MDYRGQDLDAWEEVVEKAGNAEAKANLQPPFYFKEIDSRYPKGHHPLAKKEDTYWEPCDETSSNKNRAKSQISSSANQPQTQAPKKEKRDYRGGHGGPLATRVNATKVAKKDEDKTSKDLSHVKCYICHQNSHYANKYLK